MKRNRLRILMIVVIAALILGFIILSPCANAQTESCEKIITVELSQRRMSLDLWKHLKDSMNAVKFKLPVSCKFYDEVKLGDNLISDGFRGGSFIVSGTVSSWSLKVVSK